MTDQNMNRLSKAAGDLALMVLKHQSDKTASSSADPFSLDQLDKAARASKALGSLNTVSSECEECDCEDWDCDYEDNDPDNQVTPETREIIQVNNMDEVEIRIGSRVIRLTVE